MFTDLALVCNRCAVQSGGGRGFSSQWRFPDDLSEGVCLVGRSCCVNICVCMFKGCVRRVIRQNTFIFNSPPIRVGAVNVSRLYTQKCICTLCDLVNIIVL